MGDRPFFFARDLVANLKKKITLRACRPMGGRPGDIFEIFQNGHIFLKFLFFKNIKKKKPPATSLSFMAFLLNAIILIKMLVKNLAIFNIQKDLYSLFYDYDSTTFCSLYVLI